MNIKSLHTYEEVLHYAGLGELSISSVSDWDYLEGLIEEYINTPLPKSGQVEDEYDAYWCGHDDGEDTGYKQGYVEGLEDGKVEGGMRIGK